MNQKINTKTLNSFVLAMPPAASENFLNHIRDIYLADSPQNDPVNLTKIPATCDAIDRVISREVY